VSDAGYKVKKRWLLGYIIWPCFPVKIWPGGDECEFIGHRFWEFIFEWFVAPFWDGKIKVVGEWETEE